MHKIKQQKEARDNAWLEKFRQEEGIQTAGEQAWYKVIHAGEPLFEDEHSEAALTISVNRRLSDGTVIADTDLTGLVLQEKLSDRYSDDAGRVYSWRQRGDFSPGCA